MTIHLAGDSTVAACPPAEFPMSGWGALLAAHVEPPVRNLAVGGGTTESCLQTYWPELLDGLAAGDTVLLQFGHNDQKQPELLSARDGYAKRLRGMVADVQDRGARAVLCTSVERRHFVGDRIEPSHGAYPATVRDLARELDVPLIDLQVFTAWLYEDLGVEDSRGLLSHYPKGLHRTWPDGLADDTHFQRRGADKVAAFVAWSLRALEQRDAHRPAAGDPRSGGLNPDAAAGPAPSASAVPTPTADPVPEEPR